MKITVQYESRYIHTINLCSRPTCMYNKNVMLFDATSRPISNFKILNFNFKISNFDPFSNLVAHHFEFRDILP